MKDRKIMKQLGGLLIPVILAIFATFAISLAVRIASAKNQDDNDTNDTHVPPGLLLWETATAKELELEKLPASPDPNLLAKGREIYSVHCATCHGRKGDGKGPASLFLETPPRDFTKGIYKFRTTIQDGMPADMDLFRSITAGFPAFGMPSFRYLSEKERWALVHYLKSFYLNWEKFGKPEVVAISPEPPEPPGVIERGKLLYETKFNCAQCHGAAGHGDGPKAAELRDHWDRLISPRDFTLSPVFRKVGWHRADTVRILVTGVPGTPMPSQVDQLADPDDLSEFWEIARYVEHLTAEAEAEARRNKNK